MMTPLVTYAEAVADYRLRLRFDDGTTGVAGLESRLWGPETPDGRSEQLGIRI
jgi:hypothetical protein